MPRKQAIPKRFSRIPPQRTLKHLILEKIQEGGVVLLDSFFPSKYPQARLWRKALGLDASYNFKRETFSSIIAKLHAQGLVVHQRVKGKFLWRLTKVGKQALEKKMAARAKSDGQLRLMCFDIPEYDRAKRKWLRGELSALGYRQLQKSVWIGDVPFPDEFIRDLDTLSLRDHIHIMAVTSEGTIGMIRRGSIDD